MPGDAPPTIRVVSQQGDATDITPDMLPAYQARGFTVDTPEASANRAAAQSVADNTSTAKAALFAGARGLTLGGSDAIARLIGGEDARLELEHNIQGAPIASTLGSLAGALLTPGVGELGAAIREGGGILRAAGAAGAEGALYGAGNAVSELALSNDPLTAEHVASVLSSNVLLGGGIGGVAGGAFAGVERGLQLAGERLGAATAARAAVDGLPEDLATLDDAGLRDAAAAAKASHAADISAEKASLEQLRVNQRAELANQVKDFHDELATDQPIYKAVAGDDVRAIPGIGTEVASPLRQSYVEIRRIFDNPYAVQENPTMLLRPLQKQQNALENLQQRMPELQAALQGDARAAGLEYVDQALERNKAFQDAIRATSKDNPATSARLAQLQAGPSARMQQIDAAREALKNAPELGLVGQGAKGATFAGVTALAHMIPGVGLAAPFVGKAAADAVGRLFGKMAGAVGKVSEKAAGAAQKFVTATKALEPYVAPTATKVLAQVKFGPGKTDVPEDDLGALFRQRTSELYQQTMRLPDGTTAMRPEARQAMAAQLDPLRQVNPILADKVETVKARATAYLAHVAPKKPDPPALQIGPDTSRPADLAIRAWARAVRAVEDPASVEERLARGIVTPEEADAYRTVYPERFLALQQQIFAAAPELEKTLPMAKKVALSMFTGIPVTPAMQPNVLAVLQSTFDVEPGSAGGTQAPRPEPSFGRFGSLKDTDKPTPAQQREQQP
jgi:hypothetical protein